MKQALASQQHAKPLLSKSKLICSKKGLALNSAQLFLPPFDYVSGGFGGGAGAWNQGGGGGGYSGGGGGQHRYPIGTLSLLSLKGLFSGGTDAHRFSVSPSFMHLAPMVVVAAAVR